jgi:methyl-accepting chemotaxis protein
MRLLGLLHHQPRQRARQLRWVVPALLVVAGAVAATFAVQYRLADQAVSEEFFRAHKTIGHTGELLERGMIVGGVVLVALVVGIGVWAFRFTHRIVGPVHTMHRALDLLTDGDLGVRVELEREDEFHEVAEALNRLVDEFSTTLASVHELVDRLRALSAAAPGDRSSMGELQALAAELDRTMEFFRLEPRHTVGERDG